MVEKKLDIQDGEIGTDSEAGKLLGFTGDKSDGFLWKDGSYIYISFIKSKVQNVGNFSALLQRINEAGFGVKVPTPFPHMEDILRKKGFHRTSEFFKEAGEDCEVWVREAR